MKLVLPPRPPSPRRRPPRSRSSARRSTPTRGRPPRSWIPSSLASCTSGSGRRWRSPRSLPLTACAAPRARGAAVPPAPPGEPSAARALERDAESLALCAPACALANLPLLAVAPPAHAHALCWALDWLAVAPAALLLRNGQLQRQYSFDDPADWLASAAQWSTSGTPIFARRRRSTRRWRCACTSTEVAGARCASAAPMGGARCRA